MGASDTMTEISHDKLSTDYKPADN